MTRGGLVLLAAALAAVLACGRKGGSPEERRATIAAFRDPVVRKLTHAGFTVGKMEETDADPYGAKACVQGKVDRLEVLLCDYATADAAKENRTKLMGFGRGAVNGATRTSGATAMAVADRQSVDVAGKRMNRLLRTFSPEANAVASARRSKASASK